MSKLEKLKNTLDEYLKMRKKTNLKNEPITLMLEMDTAEELLGLLQGYNCLRADYILRREMTEIIPQSDLEAMVKRELAHRISEKLVEENYIEFLQNEESYHGYPEQKIRAILHVKKPSVRNENNP